MKKIEKPDLKSATLLKPADMNRIHFAGLHSPLTPKELLGIDSDSNPQNNGDSDSHQISS